MNQEESIKSFVICTFLIMFTIIIFFQDQHLQKSDIGFNSNNLITIPLDENPENKLRIYKQELNSSNIIVGVAGQSDPILTSQAKTNGKDIDCQETKIDDNFLNGFQIKLTDGRIFLLRQILLTR